MLGYSGHKGGDLKEAKAAARRGSEDGVERLIRIYEERIRIAAQTMPSAGDGPAAAEYVEHKYWCSACKGVVVQRYLKWAECQYPPDGWLWDGDRSLCPRCAMLDGLDQKG